MIMTNGTSRDPERTWMIELSYLVGYDDLLGVSRAFFLLYHDDHVICICGHVGVLCDRRTVSSVDQVPRNIQNKNLRRVLSSSVGCVVRSRTFIIHMEMLHDIIPSHHLWEYSNQPLTSMYATHKVG